MTTNASTLTTSSSGVQRSHRRISAGKILAWFVLIVAIVIVLFPFWWVIRTSLSTLRDLLAESGSLTPVGFTTINYARVLGQVNTATSIAAGGSGQAINFLLYLRNSIIVSVLTVLGQVFFSALAAYAFARLTFPGRDKIFFLYITGLMIPGVVTLIPNFILIRQLQWRPTRRGSSWWPGRLPGR